MSMNREERRAMKKKLAPIARRIAFLEKQIKSGVDVDAATLEIEKLMSNLDMIEMMAIEDYIVSNHLLDTK